jgi:hypothetical protein
MIQTNTSSNLHEDEFIYCKIVTELMMFYLSMVLNDVRDFANFTSLIKSVDI